MSKIFSLFFFALSLLVNSSFAQAPDTLPIEHSPALPSGMQEPDQIEFPASPEFDRFYGEFFKMLLMLGLIVLFLVLISWFVKRMLNSKMTQINSKSLIQVVERRLISQKTTIFILNVMGKHVVIAESHQGVTSLGGFDQKISPAFTLEEDTKEPSSD